jgi:hypothetical protein
MISKTSQARNINSNELFFEEVIAENPQNIFSNYLEMIKSQDIEQVKIYLGMAYFVVVSVILFSLFF